MSSYWAPASSTAERISIKWGSATTITTVIIRELNNATSSWRLVNNDNDEVLASGTSLGSEVILDVGAVSLKKLNLMIDGASSAPQIAEIEVYNGGAAITPTPTEAPSPAPTPVPTQVPDATPTPELSDDCSQLICDADINWRESALQTDQELVACLKESLGTPVGYGEDTTGGYDAGGGSNLVVITKGGASSPEQQILDAISSTAHNWIVFDKDDFAVETELAMYRLGCSDGSVLSALGGASTAECLDHKLWCQNNGIAAASCEDEFFNDKINDSALNALKLKLIDSNTTIDGRGTNAYFLFSGFKIGSDSSGSSTHISENVIITNNRFVGAGHTEDHNLDPDMIRSTGASHDIWIHQNTFDNTGDSAFDVKVGAYDITVSFNKLLNVKRAALHGSSDSRTINEQIRSTIHNNLFVTTDADYGLSTYNTMRRVPLLRRGSTHLFNNVFYGYRKDVMSVRVGGSALVEDSVFVNNVTNSKGDDLQDWIDNLFDEAVEQGNLSISGTYVWESNANCELSGSAGDLSRSVGTPPNLFADYNSASQAVISNNRFVAGSELRNYLLATAGKGAMTPYVSSYNLGENVILDSAPASCQ